MHSNYLTTTLARDRQAQMLADAENRRLVRSFSPARERRLASRTFAQLLVRLAHRVDPSLATVRADTSPVLA